MALLDVRGLEKFYGRRKVVDGVTWNRVLRVDKVQNSLVHERADGVTTVVTGTASYEQLGVLAAALQPAG